MYGVTFKTFLRLGYFILDQKLEAKREREEDGRYSLHICKALVSSALCRQSRDSNKKVGLTVHIVHSKGRKKSNLLKPICFVEKKVR